MKRNLLLMLWAIVAIIKAQDYQSIQNDTIYYFRDANGYFKAVQIDSVKTGTGYTEYYNFFNPKNILNETEGCCFQPYAASWLGRRILLYDDGRNCFINRGNDTLTIQTLADIDSSWIFLKISDTSNIIAKIIEIDTADLWGTIDTIKTISLTVRKLNGDSIANDIDNLQIKLSKTFGFTRLFDFFEFPEVLEPEVFLIGCGDKGERTISFRDVYNFDVGDEFHIYEESITFNQQYSYPEGFERKQIKKIIDKKISGNQDTITYSFSRVVRQTSYTIPPAETTSAWQDKIEEQYVLSSFDTVIPEKTMLSYDELKTYVILGSKYNNRQNIMTSYPLTREMDTCYVYLILLTEQEGNVENIDGLGHYYNYGSEFFMGSDIKSLVYYKKGSETWGTPYNKDELLAIEDLTYAKDVFIYPNPAHDYLTIKIIIPIRDASIKFYDLQGKIVHSEKIKNSLTQIQIKELVHGMYFYEIVNGQSVVKKEKLVVR